MIRHVINMTNNEYNIFHCNGDIVNNFCHNSQKINENSKHNKKIEMEIKEDVKDVYKEGKSGSMDQWNGSASKGTGTLSKAFLKLLLLVTFW